jgi:hypothetical protein
MYTAVPALRIARLTHDIVEVVQDRRTKPIAVLAAAALGGGLILAAVLLRPGTSAPASTDLSTVPIAKRAGFPASPADAVVFSRQMGGDALALGVVPQRGKVLLQASVVGSQGEGVPGLSVGFTFQGAARKATACGAGCYRATLSTIGRPASVGVDVGGGPAMHWRVALPAAWPPRDASALLTRAGGVWRKLRSLSFSETIASDTSHRSASTWQLQAPDRLSYQVKGGWAAVIVGDRRWDRSPKGRHWAPSAQSPLTQPIPFWTSVADAHLLGTATVHGRSAWLVSFFDPGTPAWFKVALDRRTLRTLDSRMTATAHFMHDVYSSFNTTPAIRPPG